MTIGLALDIFKNYILIALIAGVIAGYIISGLTGKRMIGVITGILIALVICVIPYLSLQPKCESCGTDMKYGQNYCNICGNYQESGDIFGKIECKNCDRRIDKESKICSYCGTKID